MVRATPAAGPDRAAAGHASCTAYRARDQPSDHLRLVADLRTTARARADPAEGGARWRDPHRARPGWSCARLRRSRTSPAGVAAARPDSVNILIGAATTLDPAAQGDIGSAAISAQLFEGLTGFDAQLKVRPALAASWDLLDGGRRIVFHLRPDLTFSDGSPLTGEDVVRSWMRIVDPDAPSPLLSLIGDVEGALAYARGDNPRPGVGRPQRRRPRRRGPPDPTRRPTSCRSSRARRSPSCLRASARTRRPLLPAGFVGSGAYILKAVDGREDDPRGQRALLGGPAADPDDRARPRHRRAQPRRGVRGRRHRSDGHLPVRRDVDRLRRDARSAAPRDRRRCR